MCIRDSVWGNTLVDGHNRYAILQKHPEIYFSTMPLPFESREEVLAWICKNQLGRRNLTPEQKYYLMGKQYEAEKAAHGGDRKSSDAKSSSLNANLIDSTKTCDRIAEENGVSKDLSLIHISTATTPCAKALSPTTGAAPGSAAQPEVTTSRSSGT